MDDATARIKNLSIAFEALSRINSEGGAYALERVETCLRYEIHKLEEEQTKIKESARSAATTTDDDISF